jgi:hypothetical protein
MLSVIGERVDVIAGPVNPRVAVKQRVGEKNEIVVRRGS